MFKKKNRVPRGIKFNNARLLSTPLFLIKIKKNELLLNRFAVAVAKKIDKRASARNKIKRLTRAALGEINKRFAQGYDFLLISKKGILKKTEGEIREALERSLKEIYLP